jgi:hypothetical protein
MDAILRPFYRWGSWDLELGMAEIGFDLKSICLEFFPLELFSLIGPACLPVPRTLHLSVGSRRLFFLQNLGGT